MAYASFVSSNLYLIIFLSSALQVLGTAALGLFSFYGLKIEAAANVMVKGKPVTHVSVSKGWLVVARIALIVLLAGIFLGGMASLAGVQ